MRTIHLDCRSQGMMEIIIADRQERYSHVEFISWNNNTLVLAYIPWCQKSVASTIIVVCGYGTITKKNIDMKARQIIYSSTIIVLGFIQSVPSLLCLASTNIIVILLGIFWGILLGIFWSSTIIGRWFFRELWRSTLRLENLMLGNIGWDLESTKIVLGNIWLNSAWRNPGSTII